MSGFASYLLGVFVGLSLTASALVGTLLVAVPCMALWLVTAVLAMRIARKMDIDGRR